ncbi:MAG: MFS transporter [Bacteroidetes bacterium]|nr:MFS transporter [Bacteroidota bacterium]
MQTTSTPTTKEKYQFTGYQKFVIAALALTQFSVVLDFMIMSPMGDMLVKSIGLNTKQFGIVLSSYAFSAGISGFLTAGFADKYDRKKLLMFFYAGFIIGTILCGFAANYYLMVAARIFTGIFGGVIASISMAIVADVFPIQERGRVMGFVQMGFGVSQVLGVPLGLKLGYLWGWPAPFFAVGALAIIIFAMIGIKMQPITEHLKIKSDKNALLHLVHTIQKKHYRIGFTAMTIIAIGGFMMMPWGSVFAINNLHLSKEELELLFMAAGIGTLIIMPIVGKLSDKIDKFKIFAIATVFMIVMVNIYTNLTPVPFMVVVGLNILFMFGIMCRMIPAQALNTALPQMQDRGAFMSISSSLQQVAGGIGAVLSGYIVYQPEVANAAGYKPLEHYNTLGIVVSCITVVSIFLVYRISNAIKSEMHLKQI